MQCLCIFIVLFLSIELNIYFEFLLFIIYWIYSLFAPQALWLCMTQMFLNSTVVYIHSIMFLITSQWMIINVLYISCFSVQHQLWYANQKTKEKKSENKIKRETRTYSFMKQNIYYIHSFGTYIRIVDVTNNLSSVYW